MSPGDRGDVERGWAWEARTRVRGCGDVERSGSAGVRRRVGWGGSSAECERKGKRTQRMPAGERWKENATKYREKSNGNTTVRKREEVGDE